jgi:hypothetical protein
MLERHIDPRVDVPTADVASRYPKDAHFAYLLAASGCTPVKASIEKSETRVFVDKQLDRASRCTLSMSKRDWRGVLERRSEPYSITGRIQLV